MDSFWSIDDEALGELRRILRDPASPLREHLKDSAAHMRLIALGLVLLLVLRFSPKGLIPER